MLEIILDIILAFMISLMIAYAPTLVYLMLKAKPRKARLADFRVAFIVFFVSFFGFSALFIHGSMSHEKNKAAESTPGAVLQKKKAG